MGVTEITCRLEAADGHFSDKDLKSRSEMSVSMVKSEAQCKLDIGV